MSRFPLFFGLALLFVGLFELGSGAPKLFTEGLAFTIFGPCYIAFYLNQRRFEAWKTSPEGDPRTYNTVADCNRGLAFINQNLERDVGASGVGLLTAILCWCHDPSAWYLGLWIGSFAYVFQSALRTRLRAHA
jgi:hypothetical protein